MHSAPSRLLPRIPPHTTVRRCLNMAYPTRPSSPSDLLTALPSKFEEARKSGQLYFFPSDARDIHFEGRRVHQSFT